MRYYDREAYEYTSMAYLAFTCLNSGMNDTELLNRSVKNDLYQGYIGWSVIIYGHKVL